MLLPFYHLSFDRELAGEWTPRTPQGFDCVKNDKGFAAGMQEPRLPRICLSPSIEGCFYAVYPNIYHLIEREKYPHIDYCLYRAYIDTEDKDFRSNDWLVKNKVVWDAHVTKEVWYLGKLKMSRYQLLRFTPDWDKPRIETTAFNDPLGKTRFISPAVDIAVIQRYAEFYKR